jgi:hypothetical protein
VAYSLANPRLISASYHRLLAIESPNLIRLFGGSPVLSQNRKNGCECPYLATFAGEQRVESITLTSFIRLIQGWRVGQKFSETWKKVMQAKLQERWSSDF